MIVPLSLHPIIQDTLRYLMFGAHRKTFPPPNVSREAGATGSLSLPHDLSGAIEDAIQVTKQLGLRSIWIDKYCIDQTNTKDKHDQIRQMDMIYQGSEVTIVAAAGEDENTGLPGAGSMARKIQPYFSFGALTVISTMPHPHQVIKGSRWMTRGWTLQESILARRRLVFTDEQVYFECNAMNCFESISVPTVGPTQTRQNGHPFTPIITFQPQPSLIYTK